MPHLWPAPMAIFTRTTYGGYGSTAVWHFRGCRMFPAAARMIPLQCKVNPWLGAATMVPRSNTTHGITFPDTVLVRSNLTGYQTKLVGNTLTISSPGPPITTIFAPPAARAKPSVRCKAFRRLRTGGCRSAPASDILPTSACLSGTVNARNFDANGQLPAGIDGNSFPNTVAATPRRRDGKHGRGGERERGLVKRERPTITGWWPPRWGRWSAAPGIPPL